MGINRRFVPPSQRRPVFQTVPGQPHLRRFIGFEGDPGTAGPKQRGLGSLGTNRDRGEFPMPADGTPGTPFYPPYSEEFMWGVKGPASTPPLAIPNDPSTPIAAAVPTDAAGTPLNTVDTGLSIPFGVSIVKWRNPTTFQSVPILPSTPGNVPVLSLNYARNALIVQNNSTATAPDIAPIFFIGFNAQPQVGLALAVAPGVGILLDIICPRDSVYIVFGPSVNGGGTVVIQGAIVQGTYAPI